MSFPEQHPWMTFFIALVSIGAVVQLAQAASPAVTKVAGVPRLPPKPVS